MSSQRRIPGGKSTDHHRSSYASSFSSSGIQKNSNSSSFSSSPLLNSVTSHDNHTNKYASGSAQSNYNNSNGGSSSNPNLNPTYNSSKGLIYSLQTDKELASIDKINDPQANILVVAGKSHLGLYKFDQQDHYGSMHMVKDVFSQSSSSRFSTNGSSVNKVPSFTSSSSFGGNKKKFNNMLSTVSDVKAGFNHYSHYVGITGTSTSVSLYDVKRSDTPLVANLSEHTRSINSLDFHMGSQQSNLLITGGQDGTVKIWDLRKLSMNSRGKSDISVQTMSDSVRDVKWCPVWDSQDSSSSLSAGSMANEYQVTATANSYIPSSASAMELSTLTNITPNNNFDGLKNGSIGYNSSTNISNSHNFNVANSSQSSTTASDGYYFASIHDSGYLLKYDLRNYSQPERKINAHSGPGLCMHWHPSGEYIITGGRDGKLCFWFVGDGKPILFPEQTINVGSPISKLKFQPTLHSNNKNMVMENTNFAMSPSGDESNISIFNLSRKYIPKTVLTTGSTSLGFVWWDENLVFNIDKNNQINGWNIHREADQLKNMKKNALKWRDIEGDGLVFVSQKTTSHLSSAPAFSQPLCNASLPSPAPTSNSSSILQKSRNRWNSGTMNSLINGRNSPAPSLMGQHYLGTSPQLVSRNSPDLQNKSPWLKNLNHPTLQRARSSVTNSQFLSQGFTQSGSFASFTNNSRLSHGSSSSHENNPMFGSQSSIQSSALLNGDETHSSIDSPRIFTLDLPYIFNTIRNKNNMERKNQDLSKIASSLKESPTEVFKFLARELKFSPQKEIDDQLQLQHIQEKQMQHDQKLQQQGSTTTSENNAGDQADDQDRNDLMERLGISNTWTQLTNSIALPTADHNKKSDSELKTNNANSVTFNTQSKTNSKHRESLSLSLSSNTPAKSERSSSISNIASSNQARDSHILRKPEQDQAKHTLMNELMELVLISEHNAETHLYIEDLTNLKIWLMIRDSLLWRLKKIASSFDGGKDMMARINKYTNEFKGEDTDLEVPLENQPGEDPDDKNVDNENKEDYEHYYEDSDSDESASLSSSLKKTNNHNSFSDSVSSAEGSSDHFSKSSTPAKKGSRSTSDTTSAKSILDEIREKLHKHPNSADENVISDEDDDESDDLISKKQFTKPIETSQRRRSRTSFIDTMMSSLRGGKLDFDNENLSRKNSMNPRLQRAPTFSLINPSPQSSATSSLLTREIKGNHSDITSVSPAKIKPSIVSKSNLATTHSLKDSAVEPWAPEILIKKFYQQAVDSGNVLLSINILLLFQNQFSITTRTVVKNAVNEFMNILHIYELFEVSAELLKYCPWGEEILGEDDTSTGQSGICLFCDRCGKLLVNESSKKNRMELNDEQVHFGYWYCDNCKKPNTLCAICEKPIKKLAVAILECGHVGHAECFTQWFVQEQMDQCPKGCVAELLTI